MFDEKVLKNVRRRGILLICLGIFLILFTGFFGFACFYVGINDNESGMIVFGCFLLLAFIFGVITLILGIRFLNPKNSHFFKNNPNILEWTNEVNSNKVYESDMFICSKKYIVNKKNSLQIASFDELLCCYHQCINYRYGVKLHQIWFITKRDTFAISLAKNPEKIVSELQEIINQFCPHVYFGYDRNKMKEFRQIQKEFRKNNK